MFKKTIEKFKRYCLIALVLTTIAEGAVIVGGVYALKEGYLGAGPQTIAHARPLKFAAVETLTNQLQGEPVEQPYNIMPKPTHADLPLPKPGHNPRQVQK